MYTHFYRNIDGIPFTNIDQLWALGSIVGLTFTLTSGSPEEEHGLATLWYREGKRHIETNWLVTSFKLQVKPPK